MDDEGSRQALKGDVLNQPPWEEAVLFACERLARGSQEQQEACGMGILAAFAVDPMLAAEMIYRSTDAVWAQLGTTVQGLIRRWHTPGKVDRALRFMISSGRPEFLNQVWPLITDENDQMSLSALRAARRFRPSLLGRDAAKRLAALSPNVRKIVLHEIALNSGVDGLDLAAAVAKDDLDPAIKSTVVDAFAFRRADRHVTEVLRSADEKTFDLLARNDLIAEVTDESVRKGLDAARERQRKAGVSTFDRLRTIIHTHGNEDHSGELTAIIANMTIDKQGPEVQLIYEARNRYPHAIASGLLQRVCASRELFYGADDLLASAGFSLEDNTLLEIALSETSRRDDRAAAAASVLGPEAVGRMIDALLEAKKRARNASSGYDRASGDRYHDLLSRVAHAPGASLIAAVRARSTEAENEEIADLAELISRHPRGKSDRDRPFDTNEIAAIWALAEEWGNRLLASAVATRAQLACISTLVSHSPSASVLPVLKRLLDEDLRQWQAFKQQAFAGRLREGTAINEARTSWTLSYQQAFQATGGPETATLMRDYLPHEDLGQSAALVLAEQWLTANEPSDDKRFRSGVDFSHVEERRRTRAANPGATSSEAEAIFSVVESLLADDATDDQKNHAVTIGVVAARLPHGERDATIQKLLSLAPRRSRAALLQGLILSGESIDIAMIGNGIAEVLAAAKTQAWILSENGYELREWLRLLPFTSCPLTRLTSCAVCPSANAGRTSWKK